MTLSDKILQWYEGNSRQLPWRNTKDPYRIWLSEIILQQTRIAQGLPYYNAFISAFPSIFDLASAEEQQVLKLWQGLGYYSRARNLHATAQHIAWEREGIFPDTYEELLCLKGVGEYTASAIASICFDEARAVIDGNVYRVLSRCFDIESSIESAQGKALIKELAHQFMDAERIGDYNQAIMEVGATICLPKSPLCPSCPLQDQCLARARNTIHLRPVKKKKKPVQLRYFDYLIFQDPTNRTLIKQRKKKDIWKNLFEFPLIESDKNLDMDVFKKGKRLKKELPPIASVRRLEHLDRVHKLSHQHLHTRFWLIKTEEELQNGIAWNKLGNYPVPILIHDTIETLKNSYF